MDVKHKAVVAQVRPAITVVLEGDGESWSAFAPGVPGCIATGASQEAVRQSLEEALEGFFAAEAEDATEELAAAGVSLPQA